MAAAVPAGDKQHPHVRDAGDEHGVVSRAAGQRSDRQAVLRHAALQRCRYPLGQAHRRRIHQHRHLHPVAFGAELLPAALGIRNGDVKLIKNAGGMITGPFDSAVRSLLVGIIELGVEEVMVIGHTDCGVAHINADMMIRHLIQRGISQDHIDMMRYCGIDFEAWLRGFDCVENSVAETVELLRNHPLMPADVTIRGYIINTETGELTPQD